MPINLACHGCGKMASVPDQFGGRRVRCKACGTTIVVPVYVPSIVEDDRPVRLAARRRRSPAGTKVISIVLVAWAGLAFLRHRIVASRGQPEDLTDSVIRAAFGLGIWGVLLGPLVAPAIMSRRRILSPLRWLVMSAFCLVSSAILFGICYAIDAADLARGNDIPYAGSVIGLFAVGLVLGLPGCLLAAAVYPKVD